MGAMDTVTATATATTSATATDTTDTAMVCTTARGPLSPATDTTAMDTATDTDTDTTDTVTDTATATTDKKFHSEVVHFRVQYKNKHKKLDHSVLVLNC